MPTAAAAARVNTHVASVPMENAALALYRSRKWIREEITATRSLSDSAKTAHSLLSWSVSRTTAAGMSITPYGRLEPRSNRIIMASVQSDIRIKIL